MSNRQLKTKLYQTIEKIQDESILKAHLISLKNELKLEQGEDFWDNLDDQTKAAIEEGLEDIKAGRTVNAFQFLEENYGIKVQR